jgi:predicted dehydrogenase
MENLKWGIIGPGRIAARFAGAIPGAERSVLHAVHSSNEDRAKVFAKEHNGKVTYTDLAAFLADDQIDIVYIANPHRFHADSVEACLKAGKPVLCEKPLTVNKAQTERLVTLAVENNVFLMEALWTRFLPVWQQVKHWIDSGEIGDVKFINSTFGFPIPRDPDDRWLNPEMAGGVLLDMGVYNVAMSQFVMGQFPTSVISDSVVGETGVDEVNSVILKYGDVRSQFTCGFDSLHENAFSIHGTKGNVFVDPLFWDTTRAVLKPHEGEDVVFEEPYKINGFEYEIMGVEKSMAQGMLQSDVIPLSDTLNTLEVMDAVLAKAGVKYPFL